MRVMEGIDTTYDSYDLSAFLCLYIPDSFRIGPDTGVDYEGYIHFSIDTVSGMFRNLGVSEKCSINSECKICSWGGAGDYLSVQLDSLPYYDSAGIKIANGVIHGYDFYAGVQCTNGGHFMCSGNCNGSNDTIKIPIQIMIIPHPNSTVSNQTVGVPPFVVTDKGIDRVLCSFHNSGVNRLEVYDFLARLVQTLAISKGQQSLDLETTSLSPGLYFARLGDQVAKFIVPAW